MKNDIKLGEVGLRSLVRALCAGLPTVLDVARPFPCPRAPFPSPWDFPPWPFPAPPFQEWVKRVGCQARDHGNMLNPRGGTSHPSGWARDLPPRPRAAPPLVRSAFSSLSSLVLARTSHWPALAFPSPFSAVCGGSLLRCLLVRAVWLAVQLLLLNTWGIQGNFTFGPTHAASFQTALRCRAISVHGAK